MKKILIALAFLYICSNAYGAVTENNKVGRIQIQGSQNNVAFYSQTGNWGVPGCPSVVEVVVESNAPLFQEMLSMTLAAKLADRDVRFLGVCDGNDASRFKANLLILY